jgi:hypothetical protein
MLDLIGAPRTQNFDLVAATLHTCDEKRMQQIRTGTAPHLTWHASTIAKNIAKKDRPSLVPGFPAGFCDVKEQC